MSIYKHLAIDCDDENGNVFFTIKTNGEYVELEFHIGSGGRFLLSQELYDSFIMAVQEFDHIVTEI